VSRRGFTVIELVVALTLGALVVLIAHRLYAGALDGAARLLGGRRELDRQVNGERWLASAFTSLEVGPAPLGGFSGSPHGVAFGSWRQTPMGWFAPVRISLEQVGDSLVGALSSGTRILVAERVSVLDCDYLLAWGANASWVRTWQSPVSAPIALRVRVTRTYGEKEAVDTMLLMRDARE